MANSLIMSYVLKKFQNVKSPVNNRWFAYVNSNGILSTRGLANHMVDHGMTNKSDVLAMLSKLSECIPELVAQGYSVKLDGIGIFYPVIANAKGGADSVEDFSVTKNIAGVRFRFKPDSTVRPQGQLRQRLLQGVCRQACSAYPAGCRQPGALRSLTPEPLSKGRGE